MEATGSNPVPPTFTGEFMADLIRLKSYTTFLDDGKSSATYKVDKGYVAIALIIGDEPAKYDAENAIDIDETILSMAKHIKECRKKEKNEWKVLRTS